MSELAPHIFRKRLIIEAMHGSRISERRLSGFLEKLSQELEMTITWGPFVKDLAGEYNSIHKGLEAIIMWVESGAQLYTWRNQKFFTLDIYSCKNFNTRSALNFITRQFRITELEYKEILSNDPNDGFKKWKQENV